MVNSVIRACEHLTDRGHEVLVVAPSGESFRTGHGHPIRVVRVAGMSIPGYAGLSVARPGGDLTATLAEFDPDVVHLASPLVLGWAGAVAAQQLGVPSVAVFQTDLSGFLRRYRLGSASPALWSMLRRLHNLADLTLVPSSATSNQLRAHGIGPLAIWQRGVDAERFHPRHRSELLRARTAGLGTMLVGFVGRLAAEKRVDLLEPISRLAGVHLVVVGDGPKRATLQRAMPQASFTGLQTGPALSRLMASLDLLVNPGSDETFCQVVQEALAAGVPVLTAAAGGPLDLVRHNENGWLWSGDDPAVLAAQVSALRSDRRALAAAARLARPSVVARTWTRIGDELIGHYRDVIAGQHGGALRATDLVSLKSAGLADAAEAGAAATGRPRLAGAP
ncbi:MAG: phosphatidylinositol alpha 1,6-mannosyltransferase [Pseudonocardiales bacterium]|nr:phosphatidylinositol alpha 1,6-mannosyltransferase [Pseudonocardiales bacterium]